MWSLFPRFITWRPRAFNSHGAWHSAHRQLNWTFHPVANLSSPWDEIRIRQPGQVWISNGWLHRISNNHGNQCACVWARVDPQTVHVHYLGTQLFNKRQKKIYLTIKKKVQWITNITGLKGNLPPWPREVSWLLQGSRSVFVKTTHYTSSSFMSVALIRKYQWNPFPLN